jgi:hypothetical protein
MEGGEAVRLEVDTLEEVPPEAVLQEGVAAMEVDQRVVGTVEGSAIEEAVTVTDQKEAVATVADQKVVVDTAVDLMAAATVADQKAVVDTVVDLMAAAAVIVEDQMEADMVPVERALSVPSDASEDLSLLSLIPALVLLCFP